jgi:hypothetical protein
MKGKSGRDFPDRAIVSSYRMTKRNFQESDFKTAVGLIVQSGESQGKANLLF